MRFLFVDEITSRAGDQIIGRRRFPTDEPLRYRAAGGGGFQVAPGAVSEAIGQLASWLCLERNDFSTRPVFLFADAIQVHGPVCPGEDLELEATLHEMDAESLRFSGVARLGGRVVQSVSQCSGYFMPLAELEDPAVTRARFMSLTRGGEPLANAGGPPYSLAALAGETTSLEAGRSVRTRTTFKPDEPFYADHFPRFPVTPIVVLNEMIGAATARVFGMEDASALRVKELRDIKIRSFVRPGETCETVVTVQSLNETGSTKHLVATGEIMKDGRRILRGSYQYEVVG